MGDIDVSIIDDFTLPVSDESPAEYGELNYIFYPGISECKHIRLTNNTAGPLTPIISFANNGTIDEIWHKTMRIYISCSGVLPSGVFDLEWSDEIAANSTQDLYVYSQCTKEGFSYKYDGSYWTNAGFNIVGGLDSINDNEEQDAAVDCDAAAANSTLLLDLGVDANGDDVKEEFVRIKFSIDALVNAEFNIEYSDDNAAWTTVYTGADLSDSGAMFQMTFWWNKPGAHRYWRIIKTDGAVAGGNITEIQWLLFEAHLDAKNFGVYGDHSCLMVDANGYMDNFEWRTSIMINIDVFSRQNFRKPIGKVGQHTLDVERNIEKYGETLQLWYIPAMTFSYNLNAFSDYQLEKRVWNVKCIISPQRRRLQYTEAADGLAPSLYRYDQRDITFLPYGPDQVGWYIVNYDFWHQYGHSFYILLDNHSYKVDDPQPIYFDDEIVAISARLFIQADMTNLATDPRSYVLTNREGVFAQFPNGMPSLPGDLPYDYNDKTTPEQRTIRWIGALLTYVYDRGTIRRPNTYSLTGTVSAGDATINGEVWLTEEWNDPATVNFVTNDPVAFGTRVDAGTGNARYFQMSRFYYWIGYVDYNGLIDPLNWIIQVFYDEDCLIPVKINLEEEGALNKVEWSYDRTLVAATGEVTLTLLGTNFESDGHIVRTPSKLYVRYRREDGEQAYYY